MFKQAQISWSHLTAAVLVAIVIVVIVLIFSGTVGRTSKDVGQCTGLLQFGDEAKGECIAKDDTCNGITVTTFGSDCSEEKPVCCIQKT